MKIRLFNVYFHKIVPYDQIIFLNIFKETLTNFHLVYFRAELDKGPVRYLTFKQGQK